MDHRALRLRRSSGSPFPLGDFRWGVAHAAGFYIDGRYRRVAPKIRNCRSRSIRTRYGQRPNAPVARSPMRLGRFPLGDRLPAHSGGVSPACARSSSCWAGIVSTSVTAGTRLVWFWAGGGWRDPLQRRCSTSRPSSRNSSVSSVLRLTAALWLLAHKLRASMVDPERNPLSRAWSEVCREPSCEPACIALRGPKPSYRAPRGMRRRPEAQGRSR